MTAGQPKVKELELLDEVKLVEILGGAADRRLEASGVLARDNVFHVVFDNTADIARIDGGLSRDTKDSRKSRSSSSTRAMKLPACRTRAWRALTCTERDGQTYLLGMCEGNRCKHGADGRRPGGGRVQVFGRGADGWDHVGTIRLPKSLWFEDHSSVAVAGARIAVVSQESSALWIGELAPAGWAVADEGTVFRFPLDRRGASRLLQR